MASGAEYTVLELDGPCLTAVSARVGPGSVHVKRFLTATRPSGMSETAGSVGEWVGEEIRRAGLPRNRGLLAVSRHDVILKEILLPAAAGATEADLAGIVRLQLARLLTMAMDGAAIDFSPLGPGADAGETMSVLAGAMPAERRQWWRAMAEAAGLKVSRIGLRAFGAASLLADLSLRRAGPVLGVAVCANSVEYVVVENGKLVFARTAELPAQGAGPDHEAFSDRVASEAKRTWMSCRVSRNGPEVELVAVLGDGELVTNLADTCGKAVGVPAVTVGPPGFVEFPSGTSEADRGRVASLIGLLAEASTGRLTLDFANPRKAPDTSARTRQVALASLLGVIVLGGGAFVLSKNDLNTLSAELSTLETKKSELESDLSKFLAEHARLSHLEQWKLGGTDWLAHLNRLSDEMPSPKDATLDSMTASSTASVLYAPGKRTYPDGDWNTSTSAEFQIAGKAGRRDVAIDLRGRLVSGELGSIYQVSNKGADQPDRFNLELRTSVQSPMRSPATGTSSSQSVPGASPGAEPLDGKTSPSPKASPVREKPDAGKEGGA